MIHEYSEKKNSGKKHLFPLVNTWNNVFAKEKKFFYSESRKNCRFVETHFTSISNRINKISQDKMNENKKIGFYWICFFTRMHLIDTSTQFYGLPTNAMESIYKKTNICWAHHDSLLLLFLVIVAKWQQWNWYDRVCTKCKQVNK